MCLKMYVESIGTIGLVVGVAVSIIGLALMITEIYLKSIVLGLASINNPSNVD